MVMDVVAPVKTKDDGRKRWALQGYAQVNPALGTPCLGPVGQCCRSVGANREREQEAGAWERIFQKMVRSEASPERFFYIYIYIYKYIYIKKKTCRMPN
jgi:hypothetical protein